ncbi:MAG: hypothetical protein ACUVXA_17450 [Candidatus Jordarchaeum sp.]|uniref:hypothetical protein n=1 Tax=Candidatus Jordarchaeum sp. TaxID=2823881 RepID=UPI004049ED5F
MDLFRRKGESDARYRKVVEQVESAWRGSSTAMTMRGYRGQTMTWRTSLRGFGVCGAGLPGVMLWMIGFFSTSQMLFTFSTSSRGIWRS